MNDFWDSWAQLAITQNLTPLGQKQETWEIDWQLDFETHASFVAYATKLILNWGYRQTINEHARKLQELNRQIFSYEAGGGRHANDARDERDRTLESLSS